MSPDPVVVHQEVLDGRDCSATAPRVIRDAASATMYEPSGSRHR